MTQKTKLVCLSDIMLVPSGVGTQMRYIAEGLLRTGRYTLRMVGGAVKHPNYTPIKVDPWGDDCVIFPKDGFGDKMFLRMLIDSEKPDALFIFTDPRFWVWLYEMSDEILNQCPIIYNHIWDNYPPPKFNNDFYRSTTFLGCISKLTHNCVTKLGHETRSAYIPHAVPHDLFKPLSEAEIIKHKEMLLGKDNVDRFVIFWNNRNARRKNPSDVIYATKMLADKYPGKIKLIMHCNPGDQEGPNLVEVMNEFNAQDCVMFSTDKIPPEKLNILYNIADVTLNIAYAEGFGLSALEARNAGCCTINNKTGGLQDQIDPEMKEEDRWGISLEPAVITYVGSQQIHTIAEDRVSHEQVVESLEYFYKLGREECRRRGQIAREWTVQHFNFDKMISTWDEKIQEVIQSYGKPPYDHWKPWRTHII